MQEITESGVRGFLRWLQIVQPDIYKKAAPLIARQVPAAFGDYNAGGWRTAGMTPAQAVEQLGYIGDTMPEIIVTGGSTPISYTGGAPLFDTGPITVAAPPTIDVAMAANQGGASSGTTDLIGSIVKGISSLYLGKKQADIQQQVVNTQLQRAALGLPPLPQSLSQLGVPMVNVGLSGSTGWIVGGGIAAVFALLMFGGRRGRR